MQELDYFYLLKKKVAAQYREHFPYWSKSIHEFRGREIANLQNLLEEHAGGRISEKWFYTHLKPQSNQKLPRIDTLNVLSVFVGAKNWEEFILQNTRPTIQSEIDLTEKSSLQRTKKKWMIPAFFILGLFLFGATQMIPSKKKYTLCFVDADQGRPINGKEISLQLLQKKESPLDIPVDHNGCASVAYKNPNLRLIVNAHYFHTDTIVRKLDNKHTKEIIKLKTDDYALMIHLFSTAKIKDWEKRRQQLDQMISDDAVIIQIANSANIGMEMYNKEDFIDKLTIPVNSLKNIKIIETNYQDGQIIEMRFSQNEN